ncbi:YggS family pyridoxal phosphate-dependent enzyme [Desulfovibrio sp. PG-178-WT-4]|uniref:Pyridoxal phosphate homeostasis protein n=1 Tax=Desulfovibrio porci TaxID=2605782 RepID=A0A6L5XJ91_9BACT|nr:YggS family pyridoxal phosphate-dependent enzyme [Desulfovibrio porci]MSS27182.1 YggS family pyridoxal phosphate-dependent enzyme [Desulfovibrio porci]
MTTEEALRERYARVLERLDAACAAAGRKREDVTLIAVSKLHPAVDVAEVARAGQLDFGENYVQEALQKREDLAGESACRNLRWHMIGHVQSRKAAQVAGAFALIHTLDSHKLADGLERRLAVLEARQPVLMEVNVAAEPQKSGLMAEDLPSLADHILEKCPHLELRGLMCLPPVFDAGEAARPHFARLSALREELRDRLGLPLPELSMGMSGDFAAAVAEGATMVRIGTDIFGPRPPKV